MGQWMENDMAIAPFLFFVIPIVFILLLLVQSSSSSSSSMLIHFPVPLILILALIAAILGLVPNTFHLQLVVRSLLAGTTGSAILHLLSIQCTLKFKLYAPAIILFTATLLGVISPFLPIKQYFPYILFLFFTLSTLPLFFFNNPTFFLLPAQISSIIASAFEIPALLLPNLIFQILQATFTIFSLILILLAYHHISLTPKQPITDSPRSPTHKVHTPYTASCDTIPISVPLHTYVQHSYTHTRFPPQSSCSCLHSSSTINLGKIKDPILPRISTRTPPDVEPSHPYPVTVGFNPPPARTPPRPATPPNLWPPISIPSPAPIYVPHEHDHDHEHEHEHEHDFTDLRDPFAPRAHLVSPPTSLPTRASHPPLTHPLTPHTRTRTGTRMSTWGRLQFPVRSPSNLSLPPFVPDLHADPASPSGNFVPRMRTNNTGKTVFKPKPISASSIRGAHVHTSPSPSPSRTGKNLKMGKGRGLKRGGSRRVKVCVLEEIDSDIDGEVEDSALLAQRLLKRLQRQV